MNALQALRKLRRFLSKKERWTKGSDAVCKNGDDVSPGDKHAVKWCLMEAIKKITGEWDVPATNILSEAVKDKTKTNDSIVDFNDAERRTHPQILALIDRAIEKAKEQT